MAETNKNLLIYFIIGVIVGIVVAPHLQSSPKTSQELVQYVNRFMGENSGEVIETKEIPGTNLSAIRVLYSFDKPFNGKTEERIGAVVRRNDGIEVGDKVKLLDVVHYNNQQHDPLWARYLETENFKLFDKR